MRFWCRHRCPLWATALQREPSPPALIGSSAEEATMTDDFTGLEEPGTASKIADGIQVANSAVSDAIETGRRPGMPAQCRRTVRSQFSSTWLAMAVPDWRRRS